jgi:hypothetical protein
VTQDLYSAGATGDADIVSPVTLSQVSSLTGGTHGAVALAINSAGTTAYILDGDNRILVVDIATNSITHTVVLGALTTTSGDVLLNHAETTLYVNNSTSGSNYTVDTSAFTSASITHYPYTIAPGDTTGYGGYTASPGRVNVIDLSSDSVTGTIDFSHFTGDYASQGALKATSTYLYMLDNFNNCLDLYQFSSSSITATVTGFTDGATRVAINSAETLAFVVGGNGPSALYVANLSSHTVTHTTSLEASEAVFVLALDTAEDYLFVGYFDWPNMDIVDASTYAVLNAVPIPVSGFQRSFALGPAYSPPSSGAQQIMIM